MTSPDAALPEHVRRNRTACRVLRENGFAIEGLKELWPGEGATTTFPYLTLDWARRWPSEEVWMARRER